MSGTDEFDEFLARRKPLFPRPEGDPLEPPVELDRVVLRQAREAIRSDHAEPMYHGTRWGTPVALAATVLLAVSVVMHVGMSDKKAPVPDVTVVNAAQTDYPASAAAPQAPVPEAPAAAVPAETAAGNAVAPRADEAFVADVRPLELGRTEKSSGVPGGFVSTEEGNRYAPAPPPPPVAGARARDVREPTATASTAGSQVVVTSQPPPTDAERAMGNATSTPAYRREAQAWQAEIARLRASGRTAEADAEQALYNQQHRAYAGAPDR